MNILPAATHVATDQMSTKPWAAPGVLVASGGAILIGGANAIVTFFSNLGSSI
jgi:hypothetical protein